jgi:hypothetical protein
MYSYCCVYVFLFLCMFRSRYCFIVLFCVLFVRKCVPGVNQNAINKYNKNDRP